MRSLIRSFLPSCVVILLGGGALWVATDGFHAFTEEAARRLYVAENKPEIPSLMLEDMHGNTTKLSQKTGLSEKITLVEFIYTTCLTICQSAGSEYAKLRDQISEAGLGDRVRLLSISFDPVLDTPRQMRSYAENHGADGAIWTIARVSERDLSLMKRSFGLRIIPDEFGGYQHNAAIHLIDQSGRLAGIFNTNNTEEVLRGVKSKLR